MNMQKKIYAYSGKMDASFPLIAGVIYASNISVMNSKTKLICNLFLSIWKKQNLF
jgi:hypothetical protein